MLRVCRGSWIYIEEDEDLIKFFFFFWSEKKPIINFEGKKNQKIIFRDVSIALSKLIKCSFGNNLFN